MGPPYPPSVGECFYPVAPHRPETRRPPADSRSGFSGRFCFRTLRGSADATGTPFNNGGKHMARMPHAAHQSDAERREPLPPSSSLGLHETTLQYCRRSLAESPSEDLTPSEIAQARAAASTLPPPLTKAEEVFRHAHWRENRARVDAALEAADVPVRRLHRFRCCGALTRLQLNEMTGEARLCGWYCRDRVCEPCGWARTARLVSNLTRLIGPYNSRAICFTLKSGPAELSDQYNKLLKNLASMFRTSLWTDNVYGSARFIEVKFGKGGFGWHPHAHIVSQGVSVRHARLSRTWKRITGDSNNVWIEQIKRRNGAVSYAAKYAAKPIEPGVLADHHRLVDCIRVLHGRRLCGATGDWRGKRLASVDPSPGEFRTVDYLGPIFAAAHRGSVGAMNLLRCVAKAEKLEAACEAACED